MVVSEQLVRVRGDDGERALPFARLPTPGFVQRREVDEPARLPAGGTRAVDDSPSVRSIHKNRPPGRRNAAPGTLGGHVPGLTPILAEMGQEDQKIPRRTEIHLRIKHATMEILGNA